MQHLGHLGHQFILTVFLWTMDHIVPFPLLTVDLIFLFFLFLQSLVVY